MSSSGYANVERTVLILLVSRLNACLSGRCIYNAVVVLAALHRMERGQFDPRRRQKVLAPTLDRIDVVALRYTDPEYVISRNLRSF